MPKKVLPEILLTYFTVWYCFIFFTVVQTNIISLLNCSNNFQTGLPASTFSIYLEAAKVILLNHKTDCNSSLLKTLAQFELIQNNIKKIFIMAHRMFITIFTPFLHISFAQYTVDTQVSFADL